MIIQIVGLAQLDPFRKTNTSSSSELVFAIYIKSRFTKVVFAVIRISFRNFLTLYVASLWDKGPNEYVTCSEFHSNLRTSKAKLCTQKGKQECK